jgi:hypothetical protein
MDQKLISKGRNLRWKNNAEEKIGKCGNMSSRKFKQIIKICSNWICEMPNLLYYYHYNNYCIFSE